MERVRLVDWLKSERDQHVGGITPDFLRTFGFRV